MASLAWDTLDLPDDDYELVALYTEDDGTSVIYDSIEVSVDNVGDGGGGCAAAPVLAGDGEVPWIPRCLPLSGFLLIYLLLGTAASECARPRWGDFTRQMLVWSRLRKSMGG